MNKESPIKLSWNELCELFGFETIEMRAERIWERAIDNLSGHERAEVRKSLELESNQEQDITEEAIDERIQELDQKEIDSECSEDYDRYLAGVKTVAQNLFKEHCLVLTEVDQEAKQSVFTVEAEKNSYIGWYRAVRKVIETINGYGMFRFDSVRSLLESGPYETIHESVRAHLHWIVKHPEVYGDVSAQCKLDRYIRSH